MNTRNSLNEKINLMTLKILEDTPELIKYLDEIPEHDQYSTKKGVKNKDLKDYLDSLKELFETYSKNINKQTN